MGVALARLRPNPFVNSPNPLPPRFAPASDFSPPWPRPGAASKPRSRAPLVIALVGGLVALSLVPQLLLMWNARPKDVDPKDIPSRIERELPCKGECRVTHVGVSRSSAGDLVSVTVVSDKNPGRTLSYQLGASG